jgi:hypothetical protein
MSGISRAVAKAVRITAGGWDPADRLALLRRHYFNGTASMGRAPIPLTRQSDSTAHRKFVENARWSRGGVGFLTAHVVGTYNNAQRHNAAACQEFKESDIASSSWIADGFLWATATEKRSLVVFIHGDPLEGRDHDQKIGRGFKRTVAALNQGARRFDKPVLLVHGDFTTINSTNRSPTGPDERSTTSSGWRCTARPVSGR